MLGETNETLGKFKTALKQNGAEFPVSETGCCEHTFYVTVHKG